MSANALRLRGPFPRYWLASFLGDFGDGIRMAALPLLAAMVTGSPAAVGAAVALQALPWLLLGLGVGVLVDRFDLRKVIIVANLAQMVTTIVFAAAIVANRSDLLLIYTMAIVSGAGSAVREVASATALPRVVDDKDLGQANGQITAGRVVGTQLAGPASGGWLFGVATALPFVTNAGGLGIAVLLLLTLPGVFAPLPLPAGSGNVVASAWEGLGEGLRWIRNDRPMRVLLMSVAVIALADAAWFSILVLYVLRVLDLEPYLYGVLLAVGAVGGVVAGIGCASLVRRVGDRSVLVGSVFTMAATQFVLPLTANAILAASMFAASSAAFAAFNVVAATFRQRHVPPPLLGRTNSTYLTVVRGATALGGLLGGGLAEVAGIRAPFLAGVLPLLGVAVLLLLRYES